MPLRIAVVGNAGVGKSSLIAALISDTRRELQNAKELTPVQIPIGDGPPVTIVDTSGDWNSRAERICAAADAVIVVASVLDEDSMRNLLNVWPDRIEEGKPLTLAVNFSEYQLESSPNEFLNLATLKKIGFTKEEFVQWVNGEFRNHLRTIEADQRIESVLLCSAVTLSGVKDVFLKAIESVLYPIKPLWDGTEFSVDYNGILHRTWNMSRALQDSLDHSALNWYQGFCFDCVISEQDFQVITEQLRSKNPAFVNERGNVTFQGFVELHRVLFTKGNRKALWRALAALGYENQNGKIEFRNDYFPPMPIEDEARYEWKPEVLDWLETLFKANGGGKGFLVDDEVDALLRPFTEGEFDIEEDRARLEAGPGLLQRNAWLAMWILRAHIKPTEALNKLIKLGYPIRTKTVGDSEEFFLRKRPRTSNLKLLKCLVIGPSHMNNKIELLHTLRRGVSVQGNSNFVVNFLPDSDRVVFMELSDGSQNWESKIKVEQAKCFSTNMHRTGITISASPLLTATPTRSH